MLFHCADIGHSRQIGEVGRQNAALSRIATPCLPAHANHHSRAAADLIVSAAPNRRGDMTSADLSFLADCLRFIALPAVLLELLREDRRNHIDHLLSKWALRLLKWSGVTLAGTLILAALSLVIAQYLWVSAGLALALIIGAAYFEDSINWRPALSKAIIAKVIMPLMFSILIGWGVFEILPPSVLLSDWSLFFFVETQVQAWLGHSAPLYQPDALTDALWTRDEHQEAAEQAFQSLGYFEALVTLQTYQRPIDQLMLHFAKGLSILIFAVLNIGVITLAAAACIIPFALIVNGIYWLSSAIKAATRIEQQARYPVGAAALLAVAEVISFAVSAKLYFYGG